MSALHQKVVEALTVLCCLVMPLTLLLIKSEWTAEEKERLGEELGEMTMYLIQLAGGESVPL